MTTPAAVITDSAAYAQAVEDAVKASAAYYTGGTSSLDDDAYDRLVRGIAAWEADHPDQVLPESPTGKVAGGALEGDVLHTVAMLSLDNVFSPEEFTASAGAARCTPTQEQSVELASRGTIRDPSRARNPQIDHDWRSRQGRQLQSRRPPLSSTP